MRSSTTAFLAAALGAWLLGPGMIPVARAYDLDTQNLVPCASEGGVCRMPYPTNVYYGAPNKRAGRPFPQGGAIACNNQNFGDTAPGQPKSCWYAPRIVAGRGDGGGFDRRGGPDGDRGRGYDDERRGGYGDRRRDDDGDRRGRYDDRPSYGRYDDRRRDRDDSDDE